MSELTVSFGGFQVARRGMTCADSGILRRSHGQTVFALVQGEDDGLTGRSRTTLAAAMLAEWTVSQVPLDRGLPTLSAIWPEQNTLPPFSLLRCSREGDALLLLYRMPAPAFLHQGRPTPILLAPKTIGDVPLERGSLQLRPGDDLFFHTRGLVTQKVKSPRGSTWDPELILAVLDPLVAAGAEGPELAEELGRKYLPQCLHGPTCDASFFALHFLSAGA